MTVVITMMSEVAMSAAASTTSIDDDDKSNVCDCDGAGDDGGGGDCAPAFSAHSSRRRLRCDPGDDLWNRGARGGGRRGSSNLRYPDNNISQAGKSQQPTESALIYAGIAIAWVINAALSSSSSSSVIGVSGVSGGDSSAW